MDEVQMRLLTASTLLSGILAKRGAFDVDEIRKVDVTLALRYTDELMRQMGIIS